MWDLLSAGSADPGAATLPASGAYRPRKSPDFGRFALIALALRFITLNYRLPPIRDCRGFLGSTLLSVLVPAWLPTQVASAHPPSIASMVIRSSTSKTHLLSTWLLRRVAKVRRTDSTLLKTKDLLRSWPCPHQHHCLTRQTKRSGQRLGDGPELAIAALPLLTRRNRQRRTPPLSRRGQALSKSTSPAAYQKSSNFARRHLFRGIRQPVVDLVPLSRGAANQLHCYSQIGTLLVWSTAGRRFCTRLGKAHSPRRRLLSANHLRHPRAVARGEPLPITQRDIGSSWFYNERENVR